MRGKAIFPEVAIIDYSLGRTLPENILKETIFDSFTHLFESLISVKQHELIQSIAVIGLQVLEENIRKYKGQKRDDEFYKKISYTSLLGGLCVAHTSTCLPHRFEQALSPIYGYSHGGGLAALYPLWVEKLSRSKIGNRWLELVLQGRSMTQYLHEILSDLGLNHYQLGLSELDISPMTVQERINGNIENDPLVLVKKELIVSELANGYFGEIK